MKITKIFSYSSLAAAAAATGVVLQIQSRILRALELRAPDARGVVDRLAGLASRLGDFERCMRSTACFAWRLKKNRAIAPEAANDIAQPTVAPQPKSRHEKSNSPLSNIRPISTTHALKLLGSHVILKATVTSFSTVNRPTAPTIARAVVVARVSVVGIFSNLPKSQSGMSKINLKNPYVFLTFSNETLKFEYFHTQMAL